MIYADNAATTQMSGAAINAMTACMRDTWGNPSSLYGLGQRAKEALEDAREQGVKKNQDAEVTLHLPEKAYAAWEAGNVLAGFDEADLATLFIVSKVTVVKREGEPADLDADATVSVKLSDAPKCPRCWNHDASIGTDGHHAELCARCAAVLGE